MLCTDVIISNVASDWRIEIHFSDGEHIGIGFGKTMREAIRHAINDALKKGISHAMETDGGQGSRT